MKKKFVVIEGCDGSGKSTLIRNLREYLGEDGVRFTNDPNSELETCIKMRDLLLNKKYDLTLQSELLMFMSARCELIDKIINPAIDAGDLVISDRFDLSTYAYQQIMRGHEPSNIAFLSGFIKTPKPSVYIYLDLDPVIGIKRSLSRLGDGNIEEDKFEKIDIKKHEEMRKYYNMISHIKPRTVKKIEVEGLSEKEVLKKVVDILKKRDLI